MNKIDELKLYYEKHKQEMDDFLRRCSEAGLSTDREELLRLLCRNILASQVKWGKAVGAVDYLSDKRLLFNGDEAAIAGGLKDFGYRFPPRGGRCIVQGVVSTIPDAKWTSQIWCVY